MCVSAEAARELTPAGDAAAQACSLWEKLHVGLRLRRFDSGVLVVQSLALSEEKARSAGAHAYCEPDECRAP